MHSRGLFNEVKVECNSLSLVYNLLLRSYYILSKFVTQRDGDRQTCKGTERDKEREKQK